VDEPDDIILHVLLGTERQDYMVLLICEYKRVEFIKVEREMVICRGCGGSEKGDTRITVQCFILTETHISRPIA
jgi:hypothetical protein